jgi:hypothetical protein
MRPDIDHPPPKRQSSASYRRYACQMHTRLAWDQLGAFQNACYRNGASMSDVVRGLMQAYVDSEAERDKA